MSNKTLGQFDIVAGGKTYTLQFTINALCALEDELGGGSIADIGETMGNRPSLKMLRTLVWVGLQQHHKAVSKEEAGDIIDAVGIEAVSAAVMSAVTASFGLKQGTTAPLAAAAPPALAKTG